MKRRPTLLFDVLAYISIYPLLIFVLVITGLGCGLIFNLVPRLTDNTNEPVPGRIRRLAALPTIPSASTPVADSASTINETGDILPESQEQTLPAANSAESITAADPAPDTAETIADTAPLPIDVQEQAAEPVSSSSDTAPESAGPTEDTNAPPATTELPTPTPTIALDFSGFSGAPNPTPTRARRPTSTPTPEGILDGLVSSLMSAISEPATTPAAHHVASLPTLTPTPTSTDTPTPTPTPTSTPTPTETPLPTVTPTPTETPLPTATPVPTNTPMPTNTPTATPVPLPTATSPPTPTPLPEYDFMLAEFFNSPTTNSFLVMYVAIVDTNEIPIGDMKIIGTRLDHNLTYESPLSTWFYEGYNAPSNVVKSGNVKFEPPGGIENTSWLIYLADANGNRISDDIPFDTNQDDKQWYFVRFKRKF